MVHIVINILHIYGIHLTHFRQKCTYNTFELSLLYKNNKRTLIIYLRNNNDSF